MLYNICYIRLPRIEQDEINSKYLLCMHYLNIILHKNQIKNSGTKIVSFSNTSTLNYKYHNIRSYCLLN